jgi:hypothetical protein
MYKKQYLENENVRYCRPNTYDNPYGNYLIGSNPNIKDCDDNLKDENNQINLYEDSNNKTIGSINKGLRDFYTMPVTEHPNDHITFIKFLMPNTLSCKINGHCLQYDDVRYHNR